MNPEPEHPNSTRAAGQHPARPASSSGWKRDLMLLVSSRLNLIQLESKDAAATALTRLSRLATLAATAFFTWALLLAGGIAWIADYTQLPWHLIAIAFAAAHLTVFVILTIIVRKPCPPVFPVSRSEFQKDREWIEKI